MRIKITLQYNGAPYFGLQSQKTTQNTVIGTLQKAFSRLGIPGKLIASGRTDRGVHASGQVLHCDLPPHWPDLKKLHHSLNRQLPSSIHIRRIEQVSNDFHARYSARRRVYRYILSDKSPNPFEADFVTFTTPINIGKINEAMQHFIGTHDFVNFKKSGSDTTNFIRTIYKAFAYQYRGKIILYFEANGYLRSQIRLMVGFLLAINEEKLDIEKLIEQLNAIKKYHVKLAPENGLYLAKVKYSLK